MPYVTPADLLTRFGAEEMAQAADRGTPRLVSAELLAAAAAATDMTGWSPADVVAVNAAMVTMTQAIEDAQSAIDGYLSARYATPMDPAPAAVRRLACDVARYYLYDDHATEAVQKRYEAAIAFFRDVSAGKVHLGADTGGTPAPASGGTVVLSSEDRVFSRRTRGW